MECVAYLRVSTERQAEEGNGLDSQRRDILSYAGKNEFVVKEWYVDDGYTGSNMDRPALKRLIKDCYDKKIKNVIAFKLDRLSRSMIDGLYIIEKIFVPNGVTFKCVHDTVSYDSPMEQAYTQMMAVFSQLDKNTMMLRMRGGMLERVKKGYWPGGGNTPYCYQYSREEGILIPVEERAEKARTALKLFVDGWSDERIQKTLGFSSEFLTRKVITSIVNIGMIPYKGEVYQGLHEPVFDKEMFELALRLREDRKSKRYVQRDARLLTGLCKCGVCGCAMRYQKWNKGHRIYCYSRNKSMDYLPNYNPDCTNGLYYAQDIERQVEEKILEISLEFTMDDFEKEEDRAACLKKQLESTNSKLKRLYMRYADGNDAVAEIISELEEKARYLKDEISQYNDKEARSANRGIQFERIKKVADVWEYIDNADKNKILKSIIEKIIIVNGDIEIVLKNY